MDYQGIVTPDIWLLDSVERKLHHFGSTGTLQPSAGHSGYSYGVGHIHS